MVGEQRVDPAALGVPPGAVGATSRHQPHPTLRRRLQQHLEELAGLCGASSYGLIADSDLGSYVRQREPVQRRRQPMEGLADFAPLQSARAALLRTALEVVEAERCEVTLERSRKQSPVITDTVLLDVEMTWHFVESSLVGRASP